MITIQDIEQLDVVANTVLRKHGGDIGQALLEFMDTASNIGLTEAATECAALKYLGEYMEEFPMTGTT